MIYFIIGLSIGIMIGAVITAYAFTKKIRTHDYTFVIENLRGRGKWVNRAERHIQEFLEQSKTK
jgi:hypothetical protein